MKSGTKLRVAIIGCGTIALDHIGAIQEDCGLLEVHLCDRNPGAARKIKRIAGFDSQVHTDALQLLSSQKFDIVHVLTPPDSHYCIAKHAIQNGANVLVEKPMTLTLEETESLYLMSEKMNRIICVDHSLLCMECVLKALEVISSGALGDVIAVHCFFGHAERRNTIPYGGIGHWAYDLPGGPLTNIISHPASILVELLGEPDSVDVMCDARNLMPYGFCDLLDVSIRSSRGYGSLTVSMAHGNCSRYVNVECEKGGIYVDFGRQLMIAKSHRGRLGFVSKALSGIGQGFSFINGTMGIIYKVATKKMKRNPGTRELVARFYRAVRNQSDCPISKENAIGVARILEHVRVRSSSRLRYADSCGKRDSAACHQASQLIR